MKTPEPEEVLVCYIDLARKEYPNQNWMSNEEILKSPENRFMLMAMQEYGKQQYELGNKSGYNQGVLDCIENAEVKQVELPKTYDPRPCFKYKVDEESMKKLLKP